MQSPSNPLVIERRIAFSQTDAAGLIHFTTYFTLMEEAEAELFRALGIRLLYNADGSCYGYPRVDCECRFRRPVGFDEKIRIELSIETVLRRRISYRFRFYNEAGKLCASGSMVTAAAIRSGEGDLQGSQLPEDAFAALENWKNGSA